MPWLIRYQRVEDFQQFLCVIDGLGGPSERSWTTKAGYATAFDTEDQARVELAGQQKRNTASAPYLSVIDQATAILTSK